MDRWFWGGFLMRYLFMSDVRNPRLGGGGWGRLYDMATALTVDCENAGRISSFPLDLDIKSHYLSEKQCFILFSFFASIFGKLPAD